MTQLEYFRDRVIPDWELTPPEVTQMLGLPPGAPLDAVLKPEHYTARDCLDALSRIHMDLQLLVEGRSFSKRWLSTPNSAPLFAGLSPAAVLRRGDLAASAAVAGYVRTALGYDYS